MADAQQFITWQSMTTYVAATTTTGIVTSVVASLVTKWNPKYIAIVVAIVLIESATAYLDLVATTPPVGLPKLYWELGIAFINALLVYAAVMGIKTYDHNQPPRGGSRPRQKNERWHVAFWRILTRPW